MRPTSLVCALCEETVRVDADRLSKSLKCPNCNQTLRIARKKTKVSAPKGIHVGHHLELTDQPADSAPGIASTETSKGTGSSLSPQQLIYLRDQIEKSNATPVDPIEHFKRNIYPSELQQPYQYPSHWTFELAVGFNICLSIGVFLLYLGLIGALAFSLAYHTYTGWDAVEGLKDGSRISEFIIFLSLLVIGLATLFFLSKPLFVKTIQPVRRKLKPEKEPLIYKLVQKVAAYSSLAPPDSIEFCLTSRTMLVPEDGKLKLIFGLHEIGTWNTRQLIYRLCYLFADRSQISQYQSLRLLDRLIRWWDTTALRYDFVDYRIQSQFKTEMIKKQHALISLVAKPFAVVCWFGVTACRKLFLFFRFATRWLCAGMMRQISQASEELACRAVGAEGVESYFMNQAYLEKMLPRAVKHFETSIGRSSVVTNFVSLVASFRNSLGDIQPEIDDKFAQMTTAKTDLDRCPRSIIEDARKSGETGLYIKEHPASDCFREFKAHCYRGTKDLNNEIQLWTWDVISASLVDTSDS